MHRIHRSLHVLFALAALLPASYAAHTARLISVSTDKCVDIAGGSSGNGADAVQWDCDGGDEQVIDFTPTAATPSVYTMRPRHSGRCLEIAGNSGSSGAVLEQASCDGGNNQKFEFRQTPEGDWEIVARHSGLLVSLSSGSSANGVTLVQQPDTNSATQRWVVSNADLRQASVYGRWDDLIPWPHIAVSAANLPDGRILTWSGSERETWPTTEFTYSATWDPASGQFVEIDHPTHNMFCAHLAMTADGQVFVNGGRNQTNSPWTSLFDWSGDQWVAIENMPSGGRWYPTTLQLPDGDMFTAIGTATNQRNPDRWDATRGWQTLTGIDFQTPVLNYGSSHGEHRWWPLLHVAPQGKIFHSGPTPTVGWINPTGSGSYEDTGLRVNDWYPKHGTTIMYDEGKILTAGGWVSGGNTTSTAQSLTVDLNGPTPVIANTNAMNFPRKFHNGVMLPTGRVLVIGGNTSGAKFNDSGAIYATEIWNPANEQWTVGADMIKPRNYHSVALLLPDARVLSAGGGYCSGSEYCSGASHRDGQIYSPPYLFNPDGSLRARPGITSGPGLIEPGTEFDVSTSGSVVAFTMIKMGSTTHGMNTDVRFLQLGSSALGGGSFRLTPNANPNVLTPGYWMVFAIAPDGTPSVAHTVRVTNLETQYDNLALGGTASQSSTAGGGDHAAVNALDGDMTGTSGSGSATQTNVESQAWWELDLLTIFELETLRLWNRSDCGGCTLADFYVLVSDEPFVSDDLNAARAQAGVSEYYVSAPVGTSIDIDLQRSGRFVRVQLAGSGALGLAEAQLFGEAPGAGTAGIVHYDYYQGAFSVLPDFNTLTPVVSGFVDGFDLSPALDANDFAMRFYGKLTIPSDGNYTFFTRSDDGSKLWIDGIEVVDNDGLHGPVEEQGSVFLTAGQHDITVGYFEATGGEELTVSWQGPGIAKSEIPTNAIALLPDPAGAGSLERHWWNGVGGTSIAALTGLPSYPDNPDGSDERLLFEAPTNWNDDYGTRMAGYLYPPFSGLYTFWIASDDNGELWLSTDDTAANRQLIATVPSWSSSREWDKFPAQQSAQIFLQSGERYFIEALQKEGGGGDNLAVAWQTPVAPREVIDGAYLSTLTTPLEIVGISAPPQVVTSPVAMSATVTGDGPTYSWSFGDGTPDTGFSAAAGTTHLYGSPGRYTVTLTVRDQHGAEVATQFQQIVHAPLTADRPNASGSIVFHDGRAEVWNVNPDNDSVSVIDANGDVRVGEIAVPGEPRGLTVAVDGRVWVASRASATISIIDPTTQQVVDTIQLARGSQPHGIVADRVSADVYVALEATGELVRFDAITTDELARNAVGGDVRQMSISADGSLLLVSRFVTPPVPGESTASPNVNGVGGEVLRVDPSDLSVLGTTYLQHSDRLASEHSGPGLPNYLQAPVISPDGANAWVASKQDNILRGQLRDGFQLTHDHTVRAISSRILLPSGSEDFAARIDHDNASVGSAAAFGPYGVFLFTALEGNRQVAISDAFFGNELARVEVGRAPQGLALSPSGNKLYVHNFMDRSVTVLDVSGLSGTDGNLVVPATATVATVSSETLAPDTLVGKQHFYDARDPRLALESYMSCASCHNGGGQDGRIWDFTGVGEGLRNTIGLEGRGPHGILHWSGNFDEVQDFEGQIRTFSQGTGLMSDPDFNATSAPLGAPKAGLSSDLDALADYVVSLLEIPQSPHRDGAGNLTAEAQAGLALFGTLGCDSCHVGVTMTDSTTGARHDVGTLTSASGQRLDGPLDGLDTPSLLGIWDTAPYLHDGSADAIADAITAHDGFGSLAQNELDELVAYLQQVEVGEPVPGGCLADDADCNGIDDDCDGSIDEDFLTSGTSCGVGECAGNSGLLECPPLVIYGSNRDGDIWEVDLTGETDTLVDTISVGTQAMELDQATGRIYFYEWLTSGDEFGYWDPATGQEVIVRSYSPGLGIYSKRMAQHPDGTMYMSDQNDNLVTIDLVTGDVTFLGVVQGLEIGALGATGDMVFGPDGTLYVVNYRALSTVDINTLIATEVADDLLTGAGINVFTGVAYCHGTLYASDAQESTGLSSIYAIDPVTASIQELWLTGDYLNDLSSCPADGTAHVATDSCNPFAGASAEICDGLDNDCDGQIDEDNVCPTGCTTHAECDDGLYCNGVESCEVGTGMCLAGTAVSCDDGVGCTTDSCDEGSDSCVNTTVDAVCDDGLYCNGSESCDAVNDCQAGTPVTCDDGVACTADACDEGADSCLFTPVDSVCDDGAFCTGAESCDPVAGCQSAGDPCPTGATCDESNDTCFTGCLTNAECDDGLFCNGTETCDGGACTSSGDPCPGQACDEAGDTCVSVLPAARLESGTVVAGGTAVTVNLTNAYFDPVVVTTAQYDNNTTPIVTRIDNVTSTSFEIRLQNPSGGTVVAETIHYLVADVGAWEIDGVRFEAQKVTSTITSEDGSWVPETLSYLQSYTDPVVLGQVMSSNDAAFSTFWSQGGARTDPPSASTLGVGKSVAEDPNVVRADETLGVIVFETAHGSIGGIEFESGESSDVVAGIGNGAPFLGLFDSAFASGPQVVVTTLAGMDGFNGGWAVLYGGAPFTTTSFEVAIDEDQVLDTERAHTPEQVHYVAFGAPFAYEPVPECTVAGDCDDGLYCNGAESCVGESCVSGSDPCPGQACDESTDSCVAAGATRFESVIVNATGTAQTVSLANNYVAPVVACTVQYIDTTTPLVPRVSNAAGSSFDLRLQSPAGDPVVSEPVHCLVVEEGLHEVDGLIIEAQRIVSTVTDENNSWNGQAASYGRSYTNPVVLGQVMTENDADWSTFWSRGSARTNPASPTDFFVGKNVGEDPDNTRADEVLGVIVIEATHATVDGVEFEARVGGDSILGVDDQPPYVYTHGTPFNASVVIATQAGMDGGNGGWAVLYGDPAVTGTELFLAIDEDTVADPERNHTSEQVGFIAFDAEFVYP